MPPKFGLTLKSAPVGFLGHNQPAEVSVGITISPSSPRIGFLKRAEERSCSHVRVRTRWICGEDAKLYGNDVVTNQALQEKRRLLALLGELVSRQRQNIENRKATANGRLPIAPRIIGKTESRLKIKSGGVRVIRRDAGSAAGATGWIYGSDDAGKRGIVSPAIRQ